MGDHGKIKAPEPVFEIPWWYWTIRFDWDAYYLYLDKKRAPARAALAAAMCLAGIGGARLPYSALTPRANFYRNPGLTKVKVL